MVEFVLTTTSAVKKRAACVILGVYQDGVFTPAAAEVDALSGGVLSRLVKRGDMVGTLGQTRLLYDIPKIRAERVLLVGCGAEKELDEGRYGKILNKTLEALQDTGVQDSAIYLTELNVPERNLCWRVRQVVQKTREASYRFTQLKTDNDKKQVRLRKMALMAPRGPEMGPAERALKEGTAIANGVELAKDLGNLPPNICTPSHLADCARSLAKTHEAVSVTVLKETDMKKLGMGALLSVTQGSREPAKLIILEYRGGKKSNKSVVLVGKGVTFDSGGISIKPADRLDEMKFDMCGAASVLGALRAAIELELPLNVVGIIPATENLPGGNATKPGDIVTSLSKQTVEILNTDAEGRLILCDALTYAERFNPAVVIDIATLTGACVIALGIHVSGLFTSDDHLAKALLAAGSYADDRAWRLPLWEDYAEQLKSNFADVANVGGREGAAITAACFLARFTKAYRWAHLDIAGTAWKTGNDKGATGRPVPLLAQYLLDQVDKQGRRQSA